VHRLPPRRSGAALWAMRLLGLVATGTLLGVGYTVAMAVAAGAGDEVAIPRAAPAATAEPDVEKAREPKHSAGERRKRRAAVGVLRDQGYRPVTLADYRLGNDLRVLIGRGEGGRRAFFFAGGRFIGTDAVDDSEHVSVGRARNRSVSLSYRLFEADGDRCCTARVRFRWDGETLKPQTEIPPAEERRRPLG
jgi:hypothetical protein